MKITKLTTIIGIGASLVLFASQGYADVLFAFNEVGGTVTMTSSGSLDTTKLVSSGLADGWTGTGFQGSKNIDIIGGTSFGGVDTLFGFSPGTDISAITNPGGPFTGADNNGFAAVTTGSKSFVTYSGTTDGWVTLEAGIGVVGSDIIGGIWTPDQNWTWAGASFASLGLNIGTYTVSDASTSESITLQVIPEPASIGLLGLVSGGIFFTRRIFAV
jgi:hypothetical protein